MLHKSNLSQQFFRKHDYEKNQHYIDTKTSIS